MANSFWLKRSLIDTPSLPVEEIEVLFKKTQELKKLWNSWKGSEFPHRTLSGKTVVHLFFEPSTRTRSSFELAAKKLGASVLNFQSESSSVTKGETLLETAKNLEAMDPDLIVLRHSSAGASKLLSERLKIPVLNAGDGFHEHPTQALLDAFTINEAKGSLKGINVLIVGDIAHSRVARSNFTILKKLGAKVHVCGPPTLMPPRIEQQEISVQYNFKQALEMADVVMMLRIQMERQNQMQFPSLSEYSRFWGLNSNTVKHLKKDAIILHPGPYNEGVEISQDVASGPYSLILNQVQNGVLVRMALLDLILGTQEERRWN